MSEDAEDREVGREVRAVAERTTSPMVILDRTGHIRYANPAAGWLVGRSPDSLEGVLVLSLVHQNDRTRVRAAFKEVVAGRGLGESVEYRIRAADGSWRTVVAVASNLLDLSTRAGILVSATDVTEQRANERSLRDLALRNSVTGLPNRDALKHRLATEMTGDGALAVAFVDLDHFKRVNDCLGHTAGDTALEAAGARLLPLIPPGSFLAHFGGDTFVVVLVGLEPDRSVRLVWELLGRLGNPLFVAGNELRLAATAGVAVRDGASTPESILRDADAALTRAKSHRRGGVELFTEELRSEAVGRLAMESDLRHAIERNELTLAFQPVVRLATGSAEGSEALVRWAPRRKPVEPSTFIPLAEETGLIVPIGEWVLNSAAAVVEAGHLPKVSVNLSPRQLLDPGLPARVERLVATRHLAAGSIAFEVTETALVENFELANESLNSLRRIGCPVGLDDFGTGYSSLGYLRRLPVDFLKLDRDLVKDIDLDPQALRIAETIVALARTLSLAVIAEGVERRSQAEALNDMGCHYGQGWFYGRPSPLGPGRSGTVAKSAR